jgi:hypothetical protein
MLSHVHGSSTFVPDPCFPMCQTTDPGSPQTSKPHVHALLTQHSRAHEFYQRPNLTNSLACSHLPSACADSSSTNHHKPGERTNLHKEEEESNGKGYSGIRRKSRNCKRTLGQLHPSPITQSRPSRRVHSTLKQDMRSSRRDLRARFLHRSCRNLPRGSRCVHTIKTEIAGRQSMGR